MVIFFVEGARVPQGIAKEVMIFTAVDQAERGDPVLSLPNPRKAAEFTAFHARTMENMYSEESG